MRLVIVPATQAADRIRASLALWSRSALLEPFLWWVVEPGRVDPSAVLRIEGGEERRLQLAKAFGGADPEDVAIVALAPVTGDGEPGHGFVEAVEEAVGEVQLVLAFIVGKVGEAAMVVAPSDVRQTVPADLYRAKWLANVFIAPEDRVDPRDFNHLSGQPAGFPRHAAHGLATVADLWRSGDGSTSVLDRLVDRQPAQSPAPVQVVRCFSRVLDYGYIVDHLAAGVFLPGSDWPNPDPERFDRVADQEALVPGVVRAFASQHEQVLGLSPFAPARIPDGSPIGILAALRLLGGLLLSRAKDMPMRAVERTLSAIHDRAADRIEAMAGTAAGVTVRRWRERPTSSLDFGSLSDDLARPLFVPDGPVAPAWSDLRHVAMSLIDGSSVEPVLFGGALDLGPKRALITDPDLVVPDPRRLASEPGRHACDPLGERRAPAVTTADAPEPWKQSFVWQVGDRLAGALLEAEASGAVAPEEPAEPPATVVETPEAAGSQGEDTGKGPAAPPVPPGAVPAPGEELRATVAASRRRLRWRTVGATLVALLAGLIAWLALDDWFYQVPVILLIVLVWLYVLAGASRAAFVSEQEAERAAIELQIGALNEQMLRAQRRGDALRLRRRYAEYLDWAEIIGWLVHHPWVGDPLRSLTIRGLLPADSIPAALQVGVAEQNRRHLDELSARARVGMFQPGWLNGLYEAVEQQAMDAVVESRLHGGALTRPQRPDPAGDVSEDPESPRRMLVQAIRKGRGRHLRNHPLAEDLISFVDALSLDDVARSVRVMRADDDAGDLTPLPPSAAYFEAPAELEAVSTGSGASAVRLVAGARELGGGVVADGRVITAASNVVGVENAEVVVQGGRKIPMVVEGRYGVLAALGVAPAVAAQPEAASDDEAPAEIEVKLGSRRSRRRAPKGTVVPATAVALPADIRVADQWLEPGDAVVVLGPSGPSWGLTIAKDTDAATCTVAFGGRPTPVGSPVLDLQGRLVGIQIETSARSARTTSPTPVELEVADLRAVRAALGRADAGSGPLSGASTTGPSKAPQHSPSSFLNEPHHDVEDVALLPQHWRSGVVNRHLVTEVLPEASLSTGPGAIQRLSTGACFTEPLRVLAQRVELTVPVPPDELASSACAEDVSPAGTSAASKGLPGGLGDRRR